MEAAVTDPFLFSSCHAHEDPESMKLLVPDGPWHCPLCKAEGFNINGDPDAIMRPTPKVLDYYAKRRVKHGRSPIALGWTHDKQQVRYAALTKGIPNYAKVLDFGCGHADLYQFLKVHRLAVEYTGVDLDKDVIAENKRIYPSASFGWCPNGAQDVFGAPADHVVLCGVFNLNSGPHHFEHIKAVIRHLWHHTSVALHIDFLSPQVDYTKDTDWHQPWGQIVGFLSTLSRRHVIDCSYLAYEYTIHLYKDQEIERPRNVYVRGV